ncbi:ATP-dependent helicase HrpB [Bermanella marisrubri]|uniref:ATP-dependent helicase HrpB n=1 Tax=Bermanella marisrubri TaxID=207949 RepID=Q1N1U8_9GAMM|nr:ATP-dependent helicase HrpB [Bermanella marisrubri]EAT12183.1 ATP-dependent helicase HrpB [Oceanobacter sp. RED65] [Bermanella marisrubri]QIZ83657.1 ATP-dependent helicase HrpB [Bermanella marisrubri]
MSAYPISSHIDDIAKSLANHGQVILAAPPGTGKSTVLPLSLMEQPWLAQGQIWLLEPRRLAAKQVAKRLSQQLSEPLGQSIGLITGEDAKTSNSNKVVVMTEGILTQKLIQENDINNCALIIFDEFHERNLATDLNLALIQQCREILREDLKCLIMSATLEIDRLSEALQAPLIEVNTKIHELDILYQIKNASDNLSQQVNRACQSLNQFKGDTLVFLPGLSEIQHVKSALIESGKNPDHIFILHSSTPQKQQQALFEDTDFEKIILASDIAKTSLTIPSITKVVDSGLERIARYNANTGMDELITIEASKATMLQRAGRAGRTQHGRVIRLGSEDQFSRRSAFSPIAIEQEDLSAFALALSTWGSTELSDYLLLNKPNSRNYDQALQLLHNLDALDERFRVTDHGKQLAMKGIHPRLSHMLHHFHDQPDMLSLACIIAALLTEGDFLQTPALNSDLQLRIELITEQLLHNKTHGGRLGRINQANLSRIIKRYKKLVKQFEHQTKQEIQWHDTDVGRVLAQAYPDRIAQQRGRGYRLQNGMGASIHTKDSAKHSDYMVIAATASSAYDNNQFIKLATAIEKQTIENEFAHHTSLDTHFLMKDKLFKVTTEKFGELILNTTTSPANPEDFKFYIRQEVIKNGIEYFDFNDSQQALLNKLNLAHSLFPDNYPSFADECLINSIDDWLLPFITDVHLCNMDYHNALLSRMDWSKQQAFKQDFPQEFTLPSGRTTQIHYEKDKAIVKAKLQECFGLTGIQKIAKNRLPLEFHLLSPAQRPLAQTKDFDFFWKEVYPEVRKENRGRYAKHPWPEDPLSAIASHKTKRHM